MNQPLAYVREVLSLYTDRSDTGKKIYAKIENGSYKTEESFVRDLSQKEIDFLNDILDEEIQYAKNEQDEKRAAQLNEVYELLF